MKEVDLKELLFEIFGNQYPFSKGTISYDYTEFTFDLCNETLGLGFDIFDENPLLTHEQFEIKNQNCKNYFITYICCNSKLQ